MMKQLLCIVLFGTLNLSFVSIPSITTTTQATTLIESKQTTPTILAPTWGPAIQQWSNDINQVATAYGIDPDLIAAVVKEESNGLPDAISRVGAVGLMGVMPRETGMEWRPSSEELLSPEVNLDWGAAILTDIIRQSGGDFFSALAAYSGGWDQVNSRVPRHYATSVLNHYGRAVAARNGISPDIATQWTLAIRLHRGNITELPFLILGEQPVSGLQMYGEHTVYNYIDDSGRPFYVQGYAVPVALVIPPPAERYELFGYSDQLEAPLQARLQDTQTKVTKGNARVLIACLPSLSRLRGHASTRWFAPSQCPAWHR